MRPVLLALLGTALSVGVVMAQSSEKPSSSRASAHKKHVPTAIDSLIENGPERPNALEEATREAAEYKARSEKSEKSESPVSAERAGPSPPPVLPTVQAVPPGPPQRNLTGPEFGLVHVGSSARDVLSVRSAVISYRDSRRRWSFAGDLGILGEGQPNGDGSAGQRPRGGYRNQTEVIRPVQQSPLPLMAQSQNLR